LKYKINRVYDIKKKIINLNSGGENENKLFDILFSYHTNTYIKPQNNEIINLNNPYILN
jgi:hypothetical protein